MQSKLLKILLLLTLLIVGYDDCTLMAQKKKRSSTKQNYEQEQKKLKQQIADTERLLDDNSKNIKSQSKDIKIREEQIKKRQQLIASQQKQIDELVSDEESLTQHIGRLDRSHKIHQEKYAATLRHLYSWRSTYDWLAFIFSARTVNEGFRRIRYVSHYSSWCKEQAVQLKDEMQESEETRQQLSEVRSDHEHTLAAISREREMLAKKQAKQKQALSSLEKDKAKLESSLKRDKKRMAEIERNIQRMIEQAAAEARQKAEQEQKRQQQKQSSSKTKTPSKGGSTSSKTPATSSTPADIKLTGSFASNKGKMNYPVDATYTITDHYNRAGNGNSSIVISTRKGANACCVFEGTVIRTFQTDEEWTVIIGHGDYRSVYMNLQNVTVKNGQKVSTRQRIGTIKPEPDSNRAELRFWIYKDANPVNPEQWLRR